jgi:hypothetical protein
MTGDGSQGSDGSARLRQGFGARPSLSGLPAEATAKAGFTKNDDFCFGDFLYYIKALWGIDDNFCLPARNGGSSKIKDLAENMLTFVYFCIPSLFARTGFVLNQRVNRHGPVTKVYKTAGPVSKRYTKPALAGASAGRLAGARVQGS